MDVMESLEIWWELNTPLILEITVQEILLKFTQECPECLRGQRAGKSTVSGSKNC